jgi:hypothetical protein
MVVPQCRPHPPRRRRHASTIIVPRCAAANFRIEPKPTTFCNAAKVRVVHDLQKPAIIEPSFAKDLRSLSSLRFGVFAWWDKEAVLAAQVGLRCSLSVYSSQLAVRAFVTEVAIVHRVMDAKIYGVPTNVLVPKIDTDQRIFSKYH